MKIERKGEIFLLISLSVRIVVIHLRRQKKNRRKNDEQRVAYYSRGGPSNSWQVRENGVKVLRNQ